jgi:hypothetical protein
VTSDHEHAAPPSRGGVPESLAAALFAAALLSGTITTAILMSSGFRPYRLDPLPAALWLSGTGLAVIGTALLGWASCPPLGAGARASVPPRSLVIRVGMAVFLVGMGAASLVELFSPVSVTTG